MLRRIQQLIAVPQGHSQAWLFALLSLAILAGVAGAILTEEWALFALPAGLLLAWVAIVDFHRVFFLMLACIPISIEVVLPGGLGTDLPSEPLMWLLTLISLFWFIRHFKTIDRQFVTHPLSILLLLHLSWILVATLSSADFLVSFKFLMAKGWYVIVFYFLAARVLSGINNQKELVWWYFIPTALTVLIILVRHAPHGFSFEEVNYVMGPFYRNHVMYACLLAVLTPFMWFGMYFFKRWSGPWVILAGGVLLFVVGINFAYTRAAYVALVAAVAIYWIIRFRLLKYAIGAGLVVMVLILSFVSTRDNWLEFAPDYEKTVTHRSFDNLLEATTKLQDISTMERVYRWVAASYMIQDRPLTGFGPGNFYFYYKKYTVSSFKTYVSDNPERSGIHNYYLMTAVEQGIPGFFIFLVFAIAALLYGEKIYHQCTEDHHKWITAAATLSFALIVLLMLMNDFVETDKIGSLFFINLAILVNIDIQNRRNRNNIGSK